MSTPDRVPQRLLFRLAPVLLIFLATLATGCAHNTRVATGRGRLPLIDPVARPVPPAAIPSGGVVMLARAEWDDGSVHTGSFAPMGRVRLVTVHHEGTPEVNNLSSREDVAEHIRRTQKWHSATNGWSDIGYHYIIDRAGRIWEGRLVRYQGAHAGNGDANRGNIGIELLGNYDLQEVTPAQRAALRKLLVDLLRRHGLKASDVLGHDEVRSRFGLSATDCPGGHLRDYLRKLRRELGSARRSAIGIG